jgi:hypothetical protein
MCCKTLRYATDKERDFRNWLIGVLRPLPGVRPSHEVAQGNRVKKLCGDKACEEVVIPGGDFAAESEGILSPGSPD